MFYLLSFIFFIFQAGPAKGQTPDAGLALSFPADTVLCSYSVRLKKDFYRVVNDISHIKPEVFRQIKVYPQYNVCAKDKVFLVLSKTDTSSAMVEISVSRSIYDGSYIFNFKPVESEQTNTRVSGMIIVKPVGISATLVVINIKLLGNSDNELCGSLIDDFVNYLHK